MSTTVKYHTCSFPFKAFEEKDTKLQNMHLGVKRLSPSPSVCGAFPLTCDTHTHTHYIYIYYILYIYIMQLYVIIYIYIHFNICIICIHKVSACPKSSNNMDGIRFICYSFIYILLFGLWPLYLTICEADRYEVKFEGGRYDTVARALTPLDGARCISPRKSRAARACLPSPGEWLLESRTTKYHEVMRW